MFDVSGGVSSVLLAVPGRVWREFRRLVSNHKWERDDDGGIYIGEAKAVMRGNFEVWAPDGMGLQVGHNLWTTEGFNYLLSVGVNDGTKLSTWYVAPFGANVAVANTLTAATFASTQTELTTAYSQSTRVAYVETAPASGSVNNTSNPAIITAASTNVSVWGFGILSESAKNSTSGKLLCATTFSSVRTLAAIGDELGIRHTLTLSNPA